MNTATNQVITNDLRQLMQNKAKALANSIDENGKKQIYQILRDSSDPWNTIKQIQQTHNLQYSRAYSGISFLDILHLPRRDVHSSLLTTLKGLILNEINSYTSEAQLIQLLNITIHFISVMELKEIPINIIMKIKKIPEKILQYLAKNNYLYVSES